MSSTRPAHEKIVSMSYQVQLSEYYRKSRALSYKKDSWRKSFQQNPANIFPRKHPLAYIFLIFSKNFQIFRRHFVFVSRSMLGRLVPSPPPREPGGTERLFFWRWSCKFWRGVRDETPTCPRLPANLLCTPKTTYVLDQFILPFIYFGKMKSIPINP